MGQTSTKILKLSENETRVGKVSIYHLATILFCKFKEFNGSFAKLY